MLQLTALQKAEYPKDMKPAFAFVLLIGFLAIAGFGFLGMNEDGAAHGKCLASVAEGMECPENAGTLASAFFHLDALKHFVLSILVAALTLLGVALFLRRSADVPIASSSFHSPLASFAFPSSRRLLAWVSLFEHSPTVLVGA
ncbi:hypothetical protein HYW30_02030 [Candidatus Azambacteria bacterium]|nr:hypothetical protein [Candidatus Azambacteria bacterium]